MEALKKVAATVNILVNPPNWLKKRKLRVLLKVCFGQKGKKPQVLLTFSTEENAISVKSLLNKYFQSQFSIGFSVQLRYIYRLILYCLNEDKTLVCPHMLKKEKYIRMACAYYFI